MINNNLRITAGFLAGILLFSSTPAEWLAVEDANTSETVTYMSDELYYFSAGAVSAMNETVVLDKDDDDTILADKETGVTENDAPVVSEPEEGGETPVTPEETPEEPARPVCTDVYVFHKGEQFACVVVFDTIIALWGQYGLTNVSTIGYGYFAVIGEIYGALTTWGNAQPAPQA